MDKVLKDVFVLTCTTIVVLVFYAIIDFIVAGILWFVIQLWNESLALNVFRYTFIILLALESLPTIPAICRIVTKEPKEGK